MGLVVAAALSARLRPSRLLGVHPAEAWSQPVVACWDSRESLRPRSLCLAVVTALVPGSQSDDRSACLVEPCALSPRLCVSSSKHTGAASRGLVQGLPRLELRLKDDVILNLIHTGSHRGGLWLS